MKKRILILLAISTMFLQGCGSVSGKKQIVFQTKASSLRILTSSLAKNKDPNALVETALEGKFYDQPQKLEPVGKDKINRNTALGALISTVSANKVCDKDWILSNFTEEEETKIKSLLQNEEMFMRYKLYQEQIKEVQVVGEAKYEDDVIYLLKFLHGNDTERKVAAVYEKTNYGWKQTNKLTEDENFDLIYAAYESGKVFNR